MEPKKGTMTHKMAMDILNNAVERFQAEKGIRHYQDAVSEFVRTDRGRALYKGVVNIRRRGEK